MRAMRQNVLPAPGPATTSTGPGAASMARSWADEGRNVTGAAKLASGSDIGSTCGSVALSPQQAERVPPFIVKKSGDAPELGQWLDRPGRLGRPHVGRLPAELLEQARNRGLGIWVVATDEHRRGAALELGMHPWSKPGSSRNERARGVAEHAVVLHLIHWLAGLPV